MTPTREDGLRILVTSVAVALFSFVIFLKIAWVCDDAYIINRSIEQLFAGNGPRWNPHERVQVFTSPLWFWTLAGLRALSTNVFLNAISVSAVFFLSTLIVVRASLQDPRKWLLATLAFVASNGFFDYTTSGLESPLAYFLIAVFLHQYLALFTTRREDNVVLFRLLWTAGLILLCRLDLVTLIAPAVVFSIVATRSTWRTRSLIVQLALSLSPLAAWSLFALVYYGAIFPNPVYAKVFTGLPRHELIVQGLGYLYVTLRHDTITVFAVVAAIIAALRAKEKYLHAIAWGVLCNIAYLIWVGGDFMLGRFLAFAYLIAIVTILRVMRSPSSMPRGAWPGIVTVVCFYLLLYPHTPLNSAMQHRSSPPHPLGIADERGAYGPGSLWRYIRRGPTQPFPAHHWSDEGLAFAQSDSCCTYRWSVGYFGYWSGTDKRIIDLNAVCDPLLSRLPMPPDTDWRIGHFSRPVPPGYVETVFAGDNIIADPDTRAYNDHVRLLTQSEPLLTSRRFRAIFGRAR